MKKLTQTTLAFGLMVTVPILLAPSHGGVDYV